MSKRQVHNSTSVKCECGRVLAFWRGGKLYIKCKRCKCETEVPIVEPKTHEVIKGR